ncbi:RGCVC family protein [Pseudonocardia xinjiangensis]|uniref:RGCVC family protein n=1 Tax=Pseudonocardia xinjiangensis TaxID=75289 RepID=UPI003D8F89A4
MGSGAFRTWAAKLASSSTKAHTGRILPFGDGSTDITSAPSTQTTTSTLTAPRGTADPDATEVACLACEHPWDAHDAISTRYCTATIKGGGTGRGCVCRLPA